MSPDVLDLSLERLAVIDARIDGHEGAALRDRWEFGRQMLAARDGAGRLPNGYLAELVERTGKSQRELGYRAQFAAAFPTEDELCTAVQDFTSWTDLRSTLKKAKDAADNEVVDPSPAPEGKFATFVADPPWRYGNTSTRGAAENHYGTMSIEELCALTVVPENSADQAHLYLWTTAGHLPEAFRVMEAWGFEYKTTVVFFRPAVEGQDDPLEVLIYPNPQGWRQVTRAQFKHWLNVWAVRAERKAAA